MSKPSGRKGTLAAHTPVRLGLKEHSALLRQVKDGLGAIERADLDCFNHDIRGLFSDSLDIDEGFKKGGEQDSRWDYLLGHEESNQIIGVEPHSATTNREIETVIAKRAAAIRQLQGHLRDGVIVSKWLWVASGRVQLLPFDKAKRQLDQNGIEFVGTKIMMKHLRKIQPGSRD